MDLALFDFDGTISDRETMPDFMHAAVRPGRLLAGKLVLMPLIVGYRMGVVSGSLVRAAICLFGFWRVPAAEVEAHGAAFAADVLPGTLRPEVLARIAWHKTRGDTVVVVSGDLDLHLRHWARGQELALLYSSLAQRGDRLTGFYRARQCVGEEKVRRIKARYPMADFDRIHAYGDSVEDGAMLAMADERWYRGKRLPSVSRWHWNDALSWHVNSAPKPANMGSFSPLHPLRRLFVWRGPTLRVRLTVQRNPQPSELRIARMLSPRRGCAASGP